MNGHRQWDQMVRLFFLYSAIYSYENLPNSTKMFPIEVQSFAKYDINPKTIAKDFNILPKSQIFDKFGHTAYLCKKRRWVNVK